MSSTVLLGIAAIALAGLFRTQTGLYPDTAQRLPVLLIWIIVGLALAMFAEAAWERSRRAKGRAVAGDDEPPPPMKPRVLALYGVAIAAYVWLIPIVGYLVTTTVFIAGVLLATHIVRPVSALVVAVGTTAFLWLLFIWTLSLPVPVLPFLS
ncbi:MAG: tripartite tricarboxylate transporter TctB family protein [Rubrivivax sp.]